MEPFVKIVFASLFFWLQNYISKTGNSKAFEGERLGFNVGDAFDLFQRSQKLLFDGIIVPPQVLKQLKIANARADVRKRMKFSCVVQDPRP